MWGEKYRPTPHGLKGRGKRFQTKRKEKKKKTVIHPILMMMVIVIVIVFFPPSPLPQMNKFIHFCSVTFGR